MCGVQLDTIRSKENGEGAYAGLDLLPNHTKNRPWCISSWDLNKDAPLHVHVEDSFASESIAGRKLCRNRWPTISTLEKKAIGPADYVDVSNEMVTCVVGYGKKLFGKEKELEKKSVTSNTTSSSSRLGREKASEAEPPLPPPQQHPQNDEDYVDPLLFYHESYQLDNTRAHFLVTLLAVREPGRAEPELSDPFFLSVLAQEWKRLQRDEERWKLSQVQEGVENL
ncbi:hypothetical protein BKA70DRAFT_1242811 [Coprinopsis sp. MPI-PUGE-AT-0042]|nr:hypothetical protein BKA70DRAFT_1242811 [Coprinopsis sp. MPI-PUGE-AT-0042]